MKEFEAEVTVVLIAAINTALVSCELVPRLFEFHGGFLSWPAASRACRSRGGLLATIHDIGTIPELQFDHLQVSNVKFWTGLSGDESGTWGWEDGSPLSWVNWAPSGPGAGNCATASIVYRYYWVKENCASLFPYVCEYQTGTCNYTTSRQTSIAGHNTQMVFEKTPEDCMEICTATTAFTCRSFEYNTELKYCQLSSGDRWTLEGYVRFNDRYHDYYHRSCNKGVLFVVESSSSAIQPTSTFLPSSLPSPSPSLIETSFSSLNDFTTSVFITHSSVWDWSTSKLIICTEYDPDDRYSSTIYPASTFVDAVVTTTLAPVQKAIVQLEKSLKVVKENARRKTKVSVPDERPSATTVGYVAGIIMFGILGAVIILDLGSLFRDLKLLKRNLKARRHRHKPTKVVLTFDKAGYNKNLKAAKESDLYVEDKETEFIEPMEKDMEPEPDYDLPPSEVFSRPRMPRMFSQSSFGEQAFSFSGSRSAENFYEDPSSFVCRSSPLSDPLSHNNQTTPKDLQRKSDIDFKS